MNVQHHQNMPISNNYRIAASWGKKLVIIIWTYITKIWEIRNKEAQHVYSLRGLKREKEFIKQKAYNLMNELKQYGEVDKDWVDIEKMQQKSLEVWVQIWKKLKLINQK